jgi:hypothetical protein
MVARPDAKASFAEVTIYTVAATMVYGEMRARIETALAGVDGI